MNRWLPVKVPPFCERLIGFSVPVDGCSLAISYEAIHLLQLADPILVETNPSYSEYDIYEADAALARYRGVNYKIIGLHGGEPLISTPYGDRLELNTRHQTISVLTGSDCTLQKPYENFSGDWAAATFSPDGMFLLLGCPYDFDFRVWRRVLATP